MAGLNGEYRHKLDAKGRLSLPSSIRKLLTEETSQTCKHKTFNHRLNTV